jgi:hypothetical protein
MGQKGQALFQPSLGLIQLDDQYISVPHLCEDTPLTSLDFTEATDGAYQHFSFDRYIGQTTCKGAGITC